MEAIFEKLEVDNRTQAALLGIALGLVNIEWITTTEILGEAHG